jgi:hypothetical protein
MLPRVGVLGVLWSLRCSIDDRLVQARVVLPAQFFPANDSTSTALASNSTCNASSEFYDQSVLGCSQCITANGASTIANSLLVSLKHNLPPVVF